MIKIAIVVVAYNRVDSLKRLLESLESSYYGSENPTLIISIDKSKTDLVERYAEDYNWLHGDKIVRKHDKNLGLRNHMMSLGEWFDKFEVLVVLEDDIIVSPNFYTFTRYTTDKYYSNEDIAGISLYSFAYNYLTGLPFLPLHNQYDVYFMNCAMSWGEVWMKPQWSQFYNWYLSHLEFPHLSHLPDKICSWEKSWLKYHTRFCIEQNKYFVHPYVSLSSNFGDVGTHNGINKINTVQVVLQSGVKTIYNLPNNIDDGVIYDGFFENKILFKTLNMSENELCLDINGLKNNWKDKRFLLSTKILDFMIVKSYGLSYRPIEMNIVHNFPGNNIFLYDTKIKRINKNKINNDLFLFFFNQQSCLQFVVKYGFKLFSLEIFTHLKNKILRCL